MGKQFCPTTRCLARFVHEFPDARDAIAEVAADGQASGELRLDAIARIRESGQFDTAVEAALVKAQEARVKSVVKAANQALRELRSVSADAREHT